MTTARRRWRRRRRMLLMFLFCCLFYFSLQAVLGEVIRKCSAEVYCIEVLGGEHTDLGSITS